MKRKIFMAALAFVLVLFGISCDSRNGEDIIEETIRQKSLVAGLIVQNPNMLIYSPQTMNQPMASITVNNDPSTHKVGSNLVISRPANSITLTTELNFNNKYWKTAQKVNIIQKIIEINQYNLTLIEVQSIIQELENLFESSMQLSSTEVLYSISFNLSIFKTTERKLQNPSNGGCTINPGFLASKVYFGCMEDMIYTKVDLLSILTEYGNEFGVDNELQNMKNNVNQSLQSTFTFKDVYSMVIPIQKYNNYLDSAQINFGINCTLCYGFGMMCGSDHGCCGNYNFCCVLKHKLCYVHDKICKNCWPKWFCLPGCKPGAPMLIPDPSVAPPIVSPQKVFPVVNVSYTYMYSFDYSSGLLPKRSVIIELGTDGKYYYKNDQNSLCLLPEGIYFQNWPGKYYEVSGGQVVNIDDLPPYCAICPYPSLPPDRFIGCNTGILQPNL
jgi:hypothetical protein